MPNLRMSREATDYHGEMNKTNPCIAYTNPINIRAKPDIRRTRSIEIFLYAAPIKAPLRGPIKNISSEDANQNDAMNVRVSPIPVRVTL